MSALDTLSPEQKEAVLQEARTELARSGGRAAAAAMTAEERTARAQKAALARWGK